MEDLEDMARAGEIQAKSLDKKPVAVSASPLECLPCHSITLSNATRVKHDVVVVIRVGHVEAVVAWLLRPRPFSPFLYMFEWCSCTSLQCF